MAGRLSVLEGAVRRQYRATVARYRHFGQEMAQGRATCVSARASRIDRHAALRAFVPDHIERHSLSALITLNFPPDLWVSRSSLSDWWQKNRPLHQKPATDSDT